MSIVWKKETERGSYQVRKVGNSVRLYTNGVFHSQFNPVRPVRGSFWELLIVPAFFHDPGILRRVLVLGVGGGAVIRLLNLFVKPREIIGVELNPVHIHIAERFFGIDQMQAQIVQGDAVAWLEDYHGPAFDLIIDDLFGEGDGTPSRAVAADSKWFRLLASNLSEHGVLVMNFLTRQEMKASAYFQDHLAREGFASAFHLSIPKYENAVGAFLRQMANSGKLRANLTSVPDLNPSLKDNGLQYRIRSISFPRGGG